MSELDRAALEIGAEYGLAAPCAYRAAWLVLYGGWAADDAAAESE